MKMIACMRILLPLALVSPLGCASEPSTTTDEAASSVRERSRGLDSRLEERMRIAASGHYLVQSSPSFSPTVSTTWGDALDIPEESVLDAEVIGPPEAAAIYPDLGIIQPMKQDSFVLLSTGLATGANGPEPGDDLPPVGVDGDSVTLSLELFVPRGANKLSLHYNFLSSESPDFVGTAYNDTFSIRLIQGVVTRDFTVASVNSSHFFDASDSRAEGSGFDIYTLNPADVDTVFGQGLPDAGLTDFQRFDADVVSSSPLTVLLTIADGGDGILNSAVLIDAFQFSAIATVDPNPGLVRDDGTLISDVDLLATGGRHVRGAVADGVTEVLLRMKVPAAGNVTFTVLGQGSPADGALRTLEGNELTTSVLASTVTTAAGEYAFAVYRVPADFAHDGAERPIEIGASFPAAALTTKTELQLRRPPVVLTHGLWSKTADWLKLNITTDANYDVTYADHPYSCDADLHIAPQQSPILTCPLTPAAPDEGIPLCLTRNTNEISDATKEALANVRRLGLAATKVDVVAHGSGGVHARRYINSAVYKNPTNRGLGDINRLITINTPHFGSIVANKITDKRDDLDATTRDTFMCQARTLAGSPVEPGDIDDLTTASSTLAGTDVPGHAVIGIGGQSIGGTYRLKLVTRFALYSNVGLSKSLATMWGGDHDLFALVTSQKGGIDDAAVSAFAMSANTTDAGKPDSDFHHSMTDERVSTRITTLLNSSVGSPLFGRFAASPAPLVAAPAVTTLAGPPLAPSNASLRIVSPAAGTVVAAGDVITVKVIAENGFVPELVAVMTDETIATSDTEPFTMNLRIPREALGPIRLLAVGFDASDEAVVSEGVVLVAQTDGQIYSASILTQDPILFGIGTKRQLAVIGRYDDGVTRDITSSFQGTTYLSSNEAIVSVSSNGTLTALRSGVATVVAQNGGVQDSITVTVKGNAEPLAVASGEASQVCVEPGLGVPVQLDASASLDPDDDPLTFSWFEGSIYLASGPTPTVMMGTGTHSIQLRVSDGQGGVASATVNIVITEDTTPPSIAILGINPIAVESGSLYVDAGATATDDCAGDLTAMIVSQSDVNTNIPGNYSVVYEVTDHVGLTATATRSVLVQDTTASKLACSLPMTAE